MLKITKIIIVFLLLPFTASADNYLDALNNESAHSSVDNATLSENNKKSQRISNRVPAQLNQTNFNIFLWENYYETYLRLSELGYTKKKSIYLQYIKLPKPDIIAIENIIKQES